jgi:predicted small secreted protein
MCSIIQKDCVMKKPIVIVGLSLMAMLAAACNTVEGAGEDVEAAGSAIDEAAEDAGAN